MVQTETVTTIIYYIDLGKLIGTENQHQSKIVNEWCVKCCLFVLIVIERSNAWG